jgi:hypothetical protein
MAQPVVRTRRKRASLSLTVDGRQSFRRGQLDANPAKKSVSRKSLRRADQRTNARKRSCVPSWPALSRKRTAPSANPLKLLERVKGIEPSSEAWEAHFNPLILLSFSPRSRHFSVLVILRFS